VPQEEWVVLMDHPEDPLAGLEYDREIEGLAKKRIRHLGITMPQYAKRIKQGRCGYCGAFDGPEHKCPWLIQDAIEADWSKPTCEGMDMPWGCPWCGVEWPDQSQDEGQRNIMAFDRWLEGHVDDCAPYNQEQRSER
jgi:hypothetical protein